MRLATFHRGNSNAVQVRHAGWQREKWPREAVVVPVECELWKAINGEFVGTSSTGHTHLHAGWDAGGFGPKGRRHGVPRANGNAQRITLKFGHRVQHGCGLGLRGVSDGAATCVLPMHASSSSSLSVWV